MKEKKNHKNNMTKRNVKKKKINKKDEISAGSLQIFMNQTENQLV